MCREIEGIVVRVLHWSFGFVCRTRVCGLVVWGSLLWLRGLVLLREFRFLVW